LLLVAIVAKVCVPPTKPRCNVATKLALPFNKITSVLSADLLSDSGAPTTYQMFRIKIVPRSFFYVFLTPTKPSEVRSLTLAAEVKGVFVHRKRLRLALKSTSSRHFRNSSQRQALVFRSEPRNSLLLDRQKQFAALFHSLRKDRMVNELLAERTLQESKTDACAWPTLLQFLVETGAVKNMLTPQTHARSPLQHLNPTYAAQIGGGLVLVLARRAARWLQAPNTVRLRFVSNTEAAMSAGQAPCTAPIKALDTVLGTTQVPGMALLSNLESDDGITKPTPQCVSKQFVFFTRSAQMVRHTTTRRAKSLAALPTTEPPAVSVCQSGRGEWVPILVCRHARCRRLVSRHALDQRPTTCGAA